MTDRQLHLNAFLMTTGHHEASCLVAPASQSSGDGGFASFCQCPYLLPGGLTTPAMWPEADSMNVVGPAYRLVAA